MKKLLIVCDVCKDEYFMSSDTISGITLDRKENYFDIILDNNPSQTDKHICRYCFEGIKRSSATWPL